MKTVIANGLEWMAENLIGHGGISVGDYGTDINKRTYYTLAEAENAAKEIGDGWRLPTKDEIKALCNMPHVWDEDLGALRCGELVFPGCGYLDTNSLTRLGNGFCSFYWGTRVNGKKANGFGFIRTENTAVTVKNLNTLNTEARFCARFVRDAKKD